MSFITRRTTGWPAASIARNLFSASGSFDADCDVDEEAVVAVHVGPRERLAGDRKNAFALSLPVLSRDQLLDPQASGRNFVGRNRQFVAPPRWPARR